MHSLLVSTDVLAAHLGDPRWVVCDCRHNLMDASYGRKVYDEGHIVGARFFSIDDDLAGAKNGKNGRHPLPEVDAFVATLERAGIGNDTQVVVYDDAGGMFAVRLWWMLKHWFGHAAVALLDGGYPTWRREGRAIDAAVPSPTRVRFVAKRNDRVVAATSDVLANLAHARQLLLDARAPERYQGKLEPLDPVAGHIPRAVNRFYQSNLNADGTFKSADALRAEFATLLEGRAPADVVNHCGSGVTGCHNILAMELAGLSGSRLYAGSWSEWCSDSSRPVAIGDKP